VRRPLAAAGIVGLLVAGAAGAAAASEVRAIAAPAVMYDGPSKAARKLYAAPRGMPVQVVSTLGQWVKVRDASGEVTWVERTDLADRRAVVTTAIATVRKDPSDAAAVVLTADRGVLLDLADPAVGESPAGWVRVRHREGVAGFVRSSEVWGL
jgi:SH3-like domain-containing protein